MCFSFYYFQLSRSSVLSELVSFKSLVLCSLEIWFMKKSFCLNFKFFYTIYINDAIQYDFKGRLCMS